MLLAALRRFLLLLGAATGVTAVASALLGALAGSGLRRSVALGLYLVGSFAVLTGFFVGNRGRMRADSSGSEGGALGSLGARRLRRASDEEQRESVATSGIVIALGATLLLLAVAVDAEHDLA